MWVNPTRGCGRGLEQSFLCWGQQGHLCLALLGRDRSWSQDPEVCPASRQSYAPEASLLAPHPRAARLSHPGAAGPQPCFHVPVAFGGSPGALLLPSAPAAEHSQALHTKLPLDSLTQPSVLTEKLFLSKICCQSWMGCI